MRIIVVGAGYSAWYCCKQLYERSYEIIAGITLDSPQAKYKSTFKAIDDLAEQNQFPLIKVNNINESVVVQQIRELSPDLIIVMGWSQIIGKEILEVPKLGTIGTHISLLPQNRGHSPLNWGIINNEKAWGVTLFFLEERVDAGDIIDQCSFPINDRDDARTLYNEATYYSIGMIINALVKLQNGVLETIKSPHTLSKSLPRRSPEDGIINWGLTPTELFNFVRALTKPYPGAFSYFIRNKIYIWKVKLYDGHFDGAAAPGEILKIISGEGILVSTGAEPILVERVSIVDDLDIWADTFFTNLCVGQSFTSENELHREVVPF